jgi:hypothetical protein
VIQFVVESCGDAKWTEQPSKGKELNVNEHAAYQIATGLKETTEMRNISFERSANIIERIKG